MLNWGWGSSVTPVRARWSRAAATGKIEEGGKSDDDILDLTGGRRAVVNGALDTPRRREHVKARGGAYGRT